MIDGVSRNQPYNVYIAPTNGTDDTSSVQSGKSVEDSPKVKRTECKTCKNRKYVDGSNEADVSFKAPGHISPGQSYATVMSHEQEHVSNARKKASGKNTKLLSATISLKMATCPECGRSYVAGGVTNTRIQYTEKNPYDKSRKLIEGSFLKGQTIDLAV